MTKKTHFKPATYPGWIEMYGPTNWVLAITTGFTRHNLVAGQVWAGAVREIVDKKTPKKKGWTHYHIKINQLRSKEEDKILKLLIKGAKTHSITFRALRPDEIPERYDFQIDHTPKKCTDALTD